MRRIELSGSASAMGEAHGELCRREIRALYAIRRDNAISQARMHGNAAADEDALLALCRRSWPWVEAFSSAVADELRGIAHGSGLGIERVLALNGLTDFRDGLAWQGTLESAGGCTAVLAAADACADGVPRLAQTWDLGTDNAPYVVAVTRRPSGGIGSWAVTTVGCLALMGMNEAGVAVGTTNLRTVDSRDGVPYVAILQRALEHERATEVIPMVRETRRAGAHNYLIADAQTLACVETTATLSELVTVESGVRVFTNHCQHRAHIELESDTPSASSHHRFRRMRELCAEAPLDRARIEACFADREGGALAIRRDDFDGISTNAAFIAEPGQGEAWACAGLPGDVPFERLR